MNTVKTFREIEAERYASAGIKLRRRTDPAMPAIEDLVVALWEHLVERRPGADAILEALQVRRAAVKARHPKNG
jgi:hypothetical protein